MQLCAPAWFAGRIRYVSGNELHRSIKLLVLDLPYVARLDTSRSLLTLYYVDAAMAQVG